MKKEKEKALHVGLILQKELQIRLGESKLYSFEFFISNIMTKVFDAFSDHLREGRLEEIIITDMRNHNIETIDWDNLGQLSKDQSRKITLSKLRIQMLHQFGENNFLCETVETERSRNQLGKIYHYIKDAVVSMSRAQGAYALLFVVWFLVKSYKLSLGLPFSSWW